MIDTDKIREENNRIFRTWVRQEKIKELCNVIDGLQNEIEQLQKEVKQLKTGTHVNKVLKDQEKEIVELREELSNTRNVNAWHLDLVTSHSREIIKLKKEIAILKANAACALCNNDYEAYKELTKAIRNAINSTENLAWRNVVIQSLRKALCKWGVKE